VQAVARQQHYPIQKIQIECTDPSINKINVYNFHNQIPGLKIGKFEDQYLTFIGKHCFF